MLVAMPMGNWGLILKSNRVELINLRQSYQEMTDKDISAKYDFSHSSKLNKMVKATKKLHTGSKVT